jgi:hypothetical protein
MRSLNHCLFTALLAGLLLGILSSPLPIAAEFPSAKDSLGQFVKSHCLDCHQRDAAEANLRLDELKFDLSNPETYRRWVTVHDRIKKGEMPPEDALQPDTVERQQAVTQLADLLHTAGIERQQTVGRVPLRRLNRVEYENTLRDLFGLPQLNAKGILPSDGEAHGFDNVSEALDLSYVQMARYLEAANHALDKAMRLGPRPEKENWRLEAISNGRFSQVAKKKKEAVVIDKAVGLLRQPNTAQAPWFFGKFGPPVDGKYRIRLRVFGFYWDKGKVLPADRPHAVTVQSHQGSERTKLKTFDVPASQDEPGVLEFTTFLRQGDQLELWFETLDDRNKPGKKELSEYSAPGVAVEWLEVEGPLIEAWPPVSYRRLFGDLPAEPWTSESNVNEPPTPYIISGIGKRAKRRLAKRNKITLYYVVPEQPLEDARRLLHTFAERAFRRPVTEQEITDYLELVKQKLDRREPFQEAMRIGYQAVLCSPEFLFLQEHPGRLDDYALASRLSYFLWNSLPDEELLSLAEQGTLHQPDVLRQQVERMLSDPKSERFVDNFIGQWLELRDINITQPDEQIYPEFDRFLQDSMVRETKAYFRKMLDENLGADHLVDSSFALVNSRLAELYGIPGVDGVALREVELPPGSPRGGFLTQASILKISANGTTTSPVIRGAWVLDHLLGQPPSPPPPNLPAIEPDLRGITTIREQLAKHREDASCASCHQTIDPPGFALESFDCIGGWRERYRSLGEGIETDRTFKNNRPVKYKLGPPVDSSGQAPNGEAFDDIHEFRQILLKQRDQLARNLIERLMIYATGGGIQFADRPEIERILKDTEESDYGLRSIVHEIVQSKTFQSK